MDTPTTGQMDDARSAWADRYGLRRGEADRCPQWLLSARSRACAYDVCLYGPSRPWLDHTDCWTLDGRPAAFTSAAYGFGDVTAREVERWVAEHPQLAWTTGVGWYGYRTTQLVFWRPDLIARVDPL